MKFTKQEAFEQLKSQLSAGRKTPAMSDRSINEQLDTLIPLLVNDESELSDFVSKVFPAFKTANANIEKDNAEFAKSYKPTNPTPPVETPVNPTPDSKLEEISRQLAELQTKLAAEEKSKTISQVRKSLKDELKNVGIKDDKWIDTYLSKIPISEDLDVKQEAQSTLDFYNISKAQVPDGTATPYTPTGDGSEKKINWEYVKKEL